MVLSQFAQTGNSPRQQVLTAQYIAVPVDLKCSVRLVEWYRAYCCQRST